MIHFAVLGIGFKQASIEIRDRVSLSDTAKIALYEQLQASNIRQAMILSTCNRSELYVLYEEESLFARATQAYLDAMLPMDATPYLFVKKEQEAIRYLFGVTAGFESLVIGEDQILGQVQDALEFSRCNGCAAKELLHLVRDAVTCAKKLKTEYKISDHPLSVCYIGMKQLNEAHALKGRTALIIGSGKMAALALKYLDEYGAKTVYSCNRRMEHALLLQKQYPNLKVIQYADRYEIMQNCDVVISATAAPHLVIEQQKVPTPKKEQFFLDLALPRDIDPKLRTIDRITLYDIDSLQKIVGHNEQLRRDLMEQALQQLEQDVSETMQWLVSSKMDHTIYSLQSRCEEIAEDTAQLLCHKLELCEHDEKTVHKLMRSAMRRLLREPILTLKALDNEQEQIQYQQVLARLFSRKEHEEHAD